MHNCDTTSGLMPLPQAISKMLSACQAIEQHETLAVTQSFGRVLAADMVATLNVPPANNSAMDGYALRFEDTLRQNQFSLAGKALAGKPYELEVAKGQCIRVMTGAIIPSGADTVVMQENVSILAGQQVQLNQAPNENGENVRLTGEDISIGQCILKKGAIINAANAALLSSVGVAYIDVIRKARVAIMATGDELIEPGAPLQQGQIYESNRTALKGLLLDHGVDIIDLGIIADTPELTEKALSHATEHADLVISCGGVSVGDADYVKAALDKLGHVEFWKVAIKPGKPFAFGIIKNTLFCGLPGNPVSSYVTFEQLVKPLLCKLQGRSTTTRLALTAQLSHGLRKRPGRVDFQRAVYYQDEQGRLMVRPLAKQSSGVMTTLANANCYIVIAAEQGNLEAGQHVKVQLFDGY